MPYQDIFDSKVYQLSETVSDKAWAVMMAWREFAREAFGKQFVAAADSIGANIAESAGRYYPLDGIRFLHYSRGSVRETQHCIKRAFTRKLVSAEWYQEVGAVLKEILFSLNAYIKFQRTRKVTTPSKQVKDGTTIYEVGPIEDIPDDNDTDSIPWPASDH